MLRKWTILVSIIITVSGITVFSFGTFSAFAQTNELLSVNTSENSYEEGDTIIIFGNVSSIISETPVTLQIFHKGNLVDIIQVTVAQDGKFTHTMLAKGPLWQKEGTYIVRASYGANGVVETSFEFLKQMKPNEFESRYKTNPLAENFNMSEVVFDWWHYGTYNIKYSHIGGDPNGYPNIRLEGKTLRIVVDQATNGYFLIGIPRSFLNSYYFCDEYPFDISNSIQKEDWEEISSGDIRFIKINLSASKTTYLIEIRGTDLMKDAQDKIKECGHPVKAINNPNWMMVGDDTMKKEIFIKQSVDYIDDLGYLHIVGEVVNNKDKPINFVKVIASIYDADKNFIDSSFSYTTLEIIPPYAKSPFDVIFSGGSLGIDSYKLQIEYLLSQPLPLKLYAKQPRITDDELGYVHVKGEIQNTGDQTAHFIKVVGNIYDSNQTLI
ncbi:MAG: FxLYD domain-containing protein, partial [Candidatus Paceibacterota bacterium]